MFRLARIWLLALSLIVLLAGAAGAGPCPVGDLDGNCKVDWQDVLRFAQQWLDPAGCSGSDCADLDAINGVDGVDFALLAENWGRCWTGSLQVTIEPQAAKDAGAQWRVDGGWWRDSHYTEQDLPVGLHTVEFKTGIAGWVRPTAKQVQVNLNETTNVSATYTELTAANLLINEFMASNGSQLPLEAGELLDGDGRSSDWIEIYNAHGQQVDISGWYLTDNKNNLYKWEFPVGSAVLDDGDYLIVFASGKDDANYPYLDPSSYYHTNFNLDVGGEYLALVAPDGATIVHDYNDYECDVNEFGYPQQRRNYSYGIIDNDPDQESYFGPATPAVQNANVLDGIVADTKFSVDRGFYEVPFFVEITTETEGANIRYTLDFSEPTVTNGIAYTAPVEITGSTSLRAAAFKGNWLPTNVDTHTYIFLDDVLTQSNDQSTLGLPSEWINNVPSSQPRIVRTADYEIDPDVTLAKSDLTTIPAISIVMNADDWFDENTGIYTNSMMYASSDLFWEKPGSVELIYPNPNVGEEFQLNAGVRITGELARWPVVNKKQGIRLLFKGDYGPSKLRTSFFPDSDVDRYDTIVMRSHWGCSWLQDPYLTTYYPGYPDFVNNDPTIATYIRDQYALDCYRDTGHISSEGRYVHLYINSLYWGLYEVVERPDASFNAEHRGGDKEDYDVLKGHVSYTSVNGELHNGSRNMWNVLFSYFDFNGTNQSTVTPVSNADYIEVQKYLDVESFADYMLTLWTIARFDFPRKNWYAAAKRGLPGQPPEKKFLFYVWDSEASLWGDFSTMTRDVNVNMKARYIDSTGSSDTGPVRLFKRLIPNTEFKLLFADRMQKFLFNDGVLTPAANFDRFMVRANEIDRAIVGESARWGDATITYANNPLTRDVEWVAERDWLINEFFPYRTDIVIEQLRDVGLYPDVNAPVFRINDSNQHGGQIDSDDELSMVAETTTIWYTLDGNDPRLDFASGNPDAVSDSAIEYGGAPFTLAASTLIKARVLTGADEWSALSEAVFAVGPVAESLRITEIMYHPQDPPAGNPDAEFIELKNITAETINLALVQFTEGIHYTFPSMELAAGQYVVVVKDPNAFAARYDTTGMNIAAGRYTGSLDNGGERIRLQDAIGQTILDFRYRDDWCEITDGQGYSLTINDAAGDPNNWHEKKGYSASTFLGGSPGQPDYGPRYGDIVINEVLAHSDTDPRGDWIELYNTTDSSIDITGWFLSDNDSNLIKYQIPSGTILEHDYIVFTEVFHFGDKFKLSENGETVYLCSGLDINGKLTGYRQQEDFGASEKDVAFGRYRKSTGTHNFVAMSQNTPGPSYEGAANAYPKVGPIVINEIMYHPDWFAGSPYNNEEFEYVQLYNITGGPVPLYDYGQNEPWKFTDGIDYTFPAAGSEVTIGAGQYIVVAKNPTAFASRFPPVPAEKIFGPYEGQLGNDGEKVELSLPGDEKNGTRYYIRVDRVNYSDGWHGDDFDGPDPWPSSADGTGSSLKRIFAHYYGNDPNNWQAGPPTPGVP